MRKLTFTNVEPIRPGYDWLTRIVLSDEFWEAEGLSEGRLVAHFRSSVPGVRLAVADSDAGTIVREDPATLLVKVAAVDTLKLAGAGIAVFDFVIVGEDDEQRPIPGRWTWPVLATVTRDIGGGSPLDVTFSARAGTVEAIFEWASPSAIAEMMPVVVPGPHGLSFRVVESDAALTPSFGRDGDTAIIRTTGARWTKVSGAWVDNEDSFWGTLLEQADEKVELARRWAEEAEDVEVDDGFSALHWAAKAEYWATRPAVLTVAANIGDIGTVAGGIAAVGTVAGVASAVATLAPYSVAIGVVAMNIAEVATVAGGIANVATVAGSIAAVGSVAGSIAAVNTVAPAVANIATVAGAIANVNAVAGSIANVNTVAANIANVNIAAINIAGILAAPQAAIDAGTYRDQALAAKDESAANALSTAGLKAAVDTIYANLVTLYSTLGSFNPTLAQLNGAAARVVAATDIVAAIVYDTTKDSDGGAWRAKADKVGSITKETLNTATRGSRATHPQKWLIVARAASVTIYDLDDAACPMWRVFAVGGGGDGSGTGFWYPGVTPSSVTALNGQLVIGFTDNSTNGGVRIIDFLADIVYRRNSNASFCGLRPVIATLGTSAFTVGIGSAIVSSVVNAVAATVLPGTPVDPVRKLPTPTIACGTAGGVSVVHYDGRVTNSAFTSAIAGVSFAQDGTLWFSQAVGVSFFFSPPSEFATNSFATRFYGDISVPRLPASGFGKPHCVIPGGVAIGGTPGLTLLRHVAGSGLSVSQQTNRSSVAYITTAYNTGWMTGDTKMALADSTADLTNLVAWSHTDDFSSGTGWTFAGTVPPSITGGQIVRAGADSGIGYGEKTISGFEIGKTYPGSLSVPACAGQINIVVGGVTVRTGTTNETGTYRFSFVATGTSLVFRVEFRQNTNGTADDLRIDLGVADRSVAGNRPVVFGTVTRSAVASGTELAAVTLDGSKYQRLPSATGMEIGTGEFSHVLWIEYDGSTPFLAFIDYGDAGATAGGGYLVRVGGSAGSLTMLGGGGTPLNVAGALRSGWNMVVIGRNAAGSLQLWANGALLGANASGGINLSCSANASLVYGTGGVVTSAGGGVGTNATAHRQALQRFSRSMPSPAQIRQMYAAESKMFEPNAKCLLAGSNNVQAAYIDQKTDLTYASKAAAGTDVFKGLVRTGTLTQDTENAVGSDLKGASTSANTGTGSSTDDGSTMTLAGTGSSNRGIRTFTVSGLTIGEVYAIACNPVVAAGTIGIGIAAALSTTAVYSMTSATEARKIFYWTADATSRVFTFFTSNSGGNATLTNISIRKVSALRLTSDNHKGVHAENDNIAIFTDREVYVKTPAIGLREAVTRQPVCAPYDRNIIRTPSAAVTTNATPTVIGYLPMDKGEAGEWFVRVSAREYGEPASPELASYEVRVTVHRPQEGNAAVAGSATYTVVSEVTSSMDLTVAANTTVQALAITGTGVASKNIEWGYEARFAPSVQQVAA